MIINTNTFNYYIRLFVLSSIEIILIAQSAFAENIKITSPAPNAEFAQSSVFEVSVDADSDFRQVAIAIAKLGLSETQTTAPFVFKIYTPETYPAYYQ